MFDGRDVNDKETQNIAIDGDRGDFKKTQNIASLRYSPIGKIAAAFWTEIPKHFPFVELDEFIVMPNHVHGILFFNKPEYRDWKPNQFGPQSQNLASVIRGYKVGVKKHATMNEIDFAWQSRFYDHIIRSEKDLNNIRQYIIDNPAKWAEDKENLQNLWM
ncbi:MAG: transposase [Bacteroidetes bacterium]|nr:transposase [Bacteroidota bacterium]